MGILISDNIICSKLGGDTMRSSTEVYKEVAERCHAYNKKSSKDAMTNAAEGSKSCLNCKHFADDEHCVLDLYDPIVKNLK